MIAFRFLTTENGGVIIKWGKHLNLKNIEALCCTKRWRHSIKLHEVLSEEALCCSIYDFDYDPLGTRWL